MAKGNNKNKGNNSKNYKGPYQNNPNFKVDNIRKHMKIEDVSPTVDPFSHISGTGEEFSSQEEFRKQKSSNRTSPTETREKLKEIGVGIINYAISPIAIISVGTFVFYKSGDINLNSEKIHTNKEMIIQNQNEIDKLDDKLDENKEKLSNEIKENSFKIQEIELNQKHYHTTEKSKKSK